jgi:hypothetical protein
MGFEGHIENGIVVTNQPLPLRDGTPVRVEPVASPNDFWRSATLGELAREQGILPPASFEELLGGWPTEDLNDGFEEEMRKWRGHDPDKRS